MTANEIATLISELLDLDDVATDDNFFEIGGNSLLALSLIKELRLRSGTEISLLKLIRSPTSEGLAYLITNNEVQKAAVMKGLGPA